MGNNCGRTAQGKREPAGQQFPVQNKLLRQTVEDQVQVDFTNHAYVQYRHISPVRATRQIDYGTSSVALFLGPRAKFLKSLKANVFLYATTASGRTAVRAILEANEVLRYYLP